jgi:hypothetical protein
MLGRHIVKSFYSDMISPNVDANLNSDQYCHLVAQNIAQLLDESTFLVAKERDEQVCHLVCLI